MEENVLDVLMFLFDNYLCSQAGIIADEVELVDELEQAGFPMVEIHKAFDWLGALYDIQKAKKGMPLKHTNAIRIFSAQEQLKLDPNCRGFLMNLEKLNLLSPENREIIIERAMAIDANTIELTQFKRVVGLVLLNASSSNDDQAWIEELIYDELEEPLH